MGVFFWSTTYEPNKRLIPVYRPYSRERDFDRATWWFIVSGSLCSNWYSFANKRYFYAEIFVVLIIGLSHRSAYKWLSSCGLYLVITASAWRNLRQCTSVSSSWDRQSSYWKLGPQTSFHPHFRGPATLHSVVGDARNSLPTSLAWWIGFA